MTRPPLDATPGIVINPTAAQMAASKLDLMIAGTRDAVLMIEGFCEFLNEEDMLRVCWASLTWQVLWWWMAVCTQHQHAAAAERGGGQV